MAEEMKMELFVEHFCSGWTSKRIENRKSQQKKAEDMAGAGFFCSWKGAVMGSMGFTGKTIALHMGTSAVVAKLGVVCAVATVGGVALLGVGSALVVGGAAAYVLADDPNKAEKEFLAGCKKSHFSRGMAKADWQHVEKALRASIKVLDGLVKRCSDLLQTTRLCIELVSDAGITPHTRSICRFVVETCVAACSEYENDEDEKFRRAFQESRNYIKRCWTDKPSDGLRSARRR